MTICVEDLRADLKVLGYNLSGYDSFKWLIDKRVGVNGESDGGAFTVATIHKVHPHAWEVKDYYHHKLMAREQETLVELLNKYGVPNE